MKPAQELYIKSVLEPIQGISVVDKIILNLPAEMGEIDTHFQNEINKWRSSKLKIKLLILAEAPLSSEGYFYTGNTGNFLSLLKKHYTVTSLKGFPFIDFLRTKGIFVLDIFQFPLPSICYRKDKNLILYDDYYISKKLAFLLQTKLIDDETIAVFRYRRLVERYLDKKPGLSLLKGQYGLLGKYVNEPSPIGIKANAAALNENVKPYLP